jgi:hypothetical protein
MQFREQHPLCDVFKKHKINKQINDKKKEKNI